MMQKFVCNWFVWIPFCPCLSCLRTIQTLFRVIVKGKELGNGKDRVTIENTYYNSFLYCWQEMANKLKPRFIKHIFSGHPVFILDQYNMCKI